MKYKQPNQKTLTFADSPYTVLQNDDILHIDTSGGAFVANLEAIVSAKRDLRIHDINGTNPIPLNPNGADLVNGFPTYTMQSAGNTTYLSSIDIGLRSVLNSYIAPAVSIYDATVGVGGEYATINLAIADSKYNLLVVGNTTETADIVFTQSLSVTRQS